MSKNDSWHDQTPIVWNGRPSRQQVFESTDPAAPPRLVISSDPLMREAATFLAFLGGVVPFILFSLTCLATVPWAWLYYFPIGALTVLLASIVGWFLWGKTILRVFPNAVRVELRFGPFFLTRTVHRDQIERLYILRDKNRVLFAGTATNRRVVLFARAEVILVAAEWLAHHLQVPVAHESGQSDSDFQPDDEWRPVPVPAASWGTPSRVWVRNAEDGVEIGWEIQPPNESPLRMFVIVSVAAALLAPLLASTVIIFNWDFETAWIAVKFGWLAVPMSWILLVLYACAKVFEKGRSPMRTISVTEDRIRISGDPKKPVKRSRADRIQLNESGTPMMDGWRTQEELVSVSIFGKRWRLAVLFLCHPNTALAIAEQLSQATGLPIVDDASERVGAASNPSVEPPRK